ncbi:MAG: phenylalanine--tRNA ligase subunit alpha [Bacteroidales bacterium]|nr:phenylalanine--tRNA ligase subunit alpha [Bacteroidales bacterium]
MLEDIQKHINILESLQIRSADDLEKFRIEYVSKNGVVNRLFQEFKSLPPEQKRIIGKYLNDLKQKAEKIWKENKDKFVFSTQENKIVDLTCPPAPLMLGSHHPVSIVRKEIIEIFTRIGYVVSDGPEIEDDWHVFTALNFPLEHPARDMQDTFFITRNPDILLRTHTSSVQIRVMETQKPPIRIIIPGRVYRNETISARSHCFFHQIEGLYIDKKVSFADLKQNLLYFSQELFGKETKIRLRPSYFPFTEPSAEMDVSCMICNGEGCPICKYSGWVEILGCGMVDPNVLENCKINSKIYSGFAFGLGIERITNLKFRIKDIRLFFENDLRFLQQFISVI